MCALDDHVHEMTKRMSGGYLASERIDYSFLGMCI